MPDENVRCKIDGTVLLKHAEVSAVRENRIINRVIVSFEVTRGEGLATVECPRCNRQYLITLKKP
jgi:hypothetical protein